MSFVPAPFLRERDRQSLTQLPSAPAGLTRLARILLLAAPPSCPAPRQVMTAQVLIDLTSPAPRI
jgi:hypothetical protein